MMTSSRKMEMEKISEEGSHEKVKAENSCRKGRCNVEGIRVNVEED